MMSELDFGILEKNIKNLMEHNNITQRSLADIAGMTQANVSKALNPDEKKHFTLDQVYRIAQHFDVSIDRLVGNTAPEDNSVSPKSAFLFLVKLLCNGDIRTFDITEKETLYGPSVRDEVYCQELEKEVDISYPAFYFQDYSRMSDFVFFDYDDSQMLHQSFCGGGNETKYRNLNYALRSILPMIKLYREKQIPEEAFQMIVDGYLDKL